VGKEEKTMDEEIQREPELSEAQLGEISGGCLACGRDKGIITRAKGLLANARAGLQRAHDQGKHEHAQFYSRDFDRQAAIVLAAQERILARGHGHLLDRPHMPDLNLPPPPAQH
jgi:hypothetical protein